MFRTVLSLLPTPGARAVGMTTAGAMALIAGQKVLATSLFARGVMRLERQWRDNHPEFDGTWAHRWQLAGRHYDRTHRDPANRVLHLVGVPLMLSGVVGLLASRPLRPLWWMSAGSFSLGWSMNLIGHALFEKNAPAFADDPLAFVAGPLWDARQLGILRHARRAPLWRRAAGAPVTVHMGEPAQA